MTYIVFGRCYIKLFIIGVSRGINDFLRDSKRYFVVSFQDDYPVKIQSAGDKIRRSETVSFFFEKVVFTVLLYIFIDFE